MSLDALLAVAEKVVDKCREAELRAEQSYQAASKALAAARKETKQVLRAVAGIRNLRELAIEEAASKNLRETTGGKSYEIVLRPAIKKVRLNVMTTKTTVLS